MNYHKLQFDIDKRLDTLCKFSKDDLDDVFDNYDARMKNLSKVYVDFNVYKSHFMFKVYQHIEKELNESLLNNCTFRDYLRRK